MTPLTSAAVEAALQQHGSNPDLLDALEQFSSVMMDEVLSRTDTIETKGLSLLGWTTAIIGFLLLGFDQLPRSPMGNVLIGTCFFAAVVGLGASWEATRTRVFQWPSVDDWFCRDEFEKPLRLRRYHLLSLLETYQTHAVVTAKKAAALRTAERALAVAALAAAAALFIRLLP